MRQKRQTKSERNSVGTQQLFTCARTGDVTALRKLLATGGDPRAIERSSGYTLLNIAVEQRDAEAVKVLLDAGADPIPGVVDNMEEAIRAGNAPIVTLLFSHSPNPNEPHIEGPGGADMTSLMYAARNGELKIVKLLVELGADVNVKDAHGDSAVIYAAKAGRKQVAAFLRKRVSPAIKARLDGFGAERRRKEMAEQLVQAIEDGDVRRVVALLEDDDLLNGLGTTSVDCPLSEAVREEKAEIVDLLLKRGADVNAVTRCSPLTWAAIRGNTHLARRLVDLGADVDGGRDARQTPLMGAATSRNTEIAKMLLAHGADVNRGGNYGRTALSDALLEQSRRGRNPVVAILRAAGAKA